MRLIYNMQVSLQARDMQETIDFYTNVLGFTLDAADPEDAPVWCAMHSGNARMMWTAVGSDTDLRQFGAPALSGRLYFYPDDVEVTWQSIKDRAEVVEPPFVTHYDMREFSIRDPNGYLLAFGSPANRDEPEES